MGEGCFVCFFLAVSGDLLEAETKIRFRCWGACQSVTHSQWSGGEQRRHPLGFCLPQVIPRSSMLALCLEKEEFTIQRDTVCLVEISKVWAESSQTWSQTGSVSLERGLEEAHFNPKRFLDACPEAASDTLIQFLVLSEEFPSTSFQEQQI